VKEQVALQRILQSRLASLRARNPSYSIRAFSKRTGLSPGTLSLVLLGKRKVSKKLAAKVADRLLLDPQERSEVLERFPRARSGAALEARDPSYLQLTADQFHVVGDWHYFAILNLIVVRGFRNDPAWIGSRLGLPVSKVEAALERLMRLGMVVKKPDGSLVRATPNYRTTDDVANVSLRKSHHQTLELAREALESEPVDRRDFTWLTFPLDSTKLPIAKSMIRRFQDELLAELGRHPECDEVYRLGIQLFSLTKRTMK
jgi:uncharacterized protein (TIGR02147 family)